MPAPRYTHDHAAGGIVDTMRRAMELHRLCGELADVYAVADPALAALLHEAAKLVWQGSLRLAWAESQHRHPWAWGFFGGLVGALVVRVLG